MKKRNQHFSKSIDNQGGNGVGFYGGPNGPNVVVMQKIPAQKAQPISNTPQNKTTSVKLIQNQYQSQERKSSVLSENDQ